MFTVNALFCLANIKKRAIIEDQENQRNQWSKLLLINFD